MYLYNYSYNCFRFNISLVCDMQKCLGAYEEGDIFTVSSNTIEFTKSYALTKLYFRPRNILSICLM